jgi:hypothetical protein
MSKRYSVVLSSVLALGTLVAAFDAGAAPAGGHWPKVYKAAGHEAADIQKAVDDFRKALGDLNANDPGSVGEGRREINWDGVPDDKADPFKFPGDFFNAPEPGRARGAEFFTRGKALLVSAREGNPTKTPIEFGRFNFTYPKQFDTFSPPRLFTSVGKKNVVDVKFFIPGSKTPATTDGFGAVFTDVDFPFSSKIEYFDRHGKLLHKQWVPGKIGKEGFSFAGVAFKKAVVWRVRVTSGNVGLGVPDILKLGVDSAVMDDFIYGEPR